ncbi:MAG: endo-1,4-beta-xylanase [Candidatus Eremiobacteraeota bacterium]|nr:endo-1,4-beta-xylanase [Candidatus Eremiobacteraeota bacterium]
MRNTLILFCLFLALGGTGAAVPNRQERPFGVFNDMELERKGVVTLKSAEELGVERTRLVIHWALVEPRKGKWNFAIADRMIAMHREAGIEMLITLHSVSPWATRKAGNHLTFLASPPKDMADYENFVRTMVARYKESVKYWQIENEVFDKRYGPSIFWDGSKEEYVNLLRHAHKVIHAADPSAKVVQAGFAHELFVLQNEDYPFFIKADKGKVKEFFEYLIERGGPFCDALDFHQYYEPESVVKELALLKSTMERFGCHKELITTEAGDIDLRLFRVHMSRPEKPVPVVAGLLAIPSVKSELSRIMKGGVSPSEYSNFGIFLKRDPNAGPMLEKYQAQGLVKRLVLSLAHGVSQFYAAWMKDQEKPMDWYFGMMSLIDTDGRKKPHYYAYRQMIRELKGFSSVKEINPPAGARAVCFSFAGREPLWVAWSTGRARTFDFSSVTKAGKLKATHIITRRGETDKDALVESITSSSVPLDETPLILECER